MGITLDKDVKKEAAGLSAQGLSEDLIQPDEALSENQIQSNAAGLSEKLIQSETAELNQNLIKPNRADTLDPLVSILIPCYNTAPFLPACLESALRQTYTNIEIIATDDASTDIRVREILEDYRARFPSRLRVVYNLENRGLFHTRIVGAMHAKGSLITCLDSDDLFYRDDIIKLAVDAFKNAPSGMRLDFVSFGFIRLGDEQIAHLQNSHDKGAPIARAVPRRVSEIDSFMGWNVWGRVYRREALLASLALVEGYAPFGLSIAEDMMSTYALMLRAHYFSALEVTGYIYRENLGSITHERGYAKKRHAALAHLVAKEFIEANPPVNTLGEIYKVHANRLICEKLSVINALFDKGLGGRLGLKERWDICAYKALRAIKLHRWYLDVVKGEERR